MSSQFGHSFRISTFGESHGGAVGVIVDGCPPRIELAEADIQGDLDRRRPGQSEIVTPRAEEDQCRILSGVFEGKTTGTPIAVVVFNKDARPESYSEMETTYRPSHADYTYQAKFGIRNWQGGGRASARETIGRVAAAAIAKKVLAQFSPALEIVAYVKSVHSLVATVDPETVKLADVEANIVRCPDAAMAVKMIDFIKQVRSEGDSIGGVVECAIRGVPPGWGEPVFDKLEAALARCDAFVCRRRRASRSAAASRALCKRAASTMTPSRCAASRCARARTAAGGIQGGISNGETIFFRVAFKPTATIFQAQDTVNVSGEDTVLKARGRHDPCVLPRAVPMVEAMAALVLCDHALRQRGQCGTF